MKIAQSIGCGAELILLGFVVWSYRFGTTVGVIATVVWFFFGFGIMTIVGWDTANPEREERSEQHGGQISSEGAPSAPPNESSP